jgi:hypothetical protein
LALAGKSKAEMNEGMKAAIEKGELPALEPSGMAYMLSKQGFLNSRCGNCSPHLMFYVPVKGAHTWGAAPLATDAPVLLATHFNGAPSPVTEVHRSGVGVVGRNVGGLGRSCSLTSAHNANSSHYLCEEERRNLKARAHVEL